MKPKRIAHIGIAVDDLDGILRIFEEKFGLKCSFRKRVPEHGVEIAIVPIGESAIEFLKPMNSSSSIRKFIDKKGSGLHHISIDVDSIEDWIEHLQSTGAEMIDKKPRIGVGDCPIAFVNPKSIGGILIELEEKK